VTVCSSFFFSGWSMCLFVTVCTSFVSQVGFQRVKAERGRGTSCVSIVWVCFCVEYVCVCERDY